MAKRGQIIYRGRDNLGKLIVTDDGTMRSLYFDSDARQSSIVKNMPERLVIPYTEAMAGALIFHPEPAKALLIGLGGGALAHFLMQTCPECSIEAVELRKEVIRIGNKYFNLPIPHKNFRVIHEDAFRFISRIKEGPLQDKYDLIFLDAFTNDGPASIMKNHNFLKECRKLLSPGGVLSINIWNRPTELRKRQIDLLHSVFDKNTFTYNLGKGKGSTILYGFTNKNMQSSFGTWRASAKKLENKFGGGYTNIIRQIGCQNFSFWKRLQSRL